MDKRKPLAITLWLLALTTALVIFCYFLIDKEVVLWLSQHSLRSYLIIKYMSEIPEIYIAVVPIIYLVIILRFSQDRWSLLDHKLLMFANTIAITQFLKAFFKFVFGRYWPETWTNSFFYIDENFYGFHPFHLGVQYGSFPSGHSATLLAGTSILWLLFPRLRWLFLILILLGESGILLMNYHFISDILAGGVLGFLVAYHIYYLSYRWQLEGHRNNVASMFSNVNYSKIQE